jgi:hypothetical protein
VNAIVAMDPALRGVGFAGAGRNENQIDFGAVSWMSWAFYGNGSYGSSAIAATATESFLVASGDFSSSPIAGPLQRHTAPQHVFLGILQQPRRFESVLSLSNLMSGRRSSRLRLDAFAPESTIAENPFGWGPRVHEGIFRVRKSTDSAAGIDEFWETTSFAFLDQSTGRQSVLE